ncbi:MAG: hypothetical protein RIQ56_387 [Candidatus Parcubacteria bacterium]|jgi:hypothetical protein
MYTLVLAAHVLVGVSTVLTGFLAIASLVKKESGTYRLWSKRIIVLSIIEVLSGICLFLLAPANPFLMCARFGVYLGFVVALEILLVRGIRFSRNGMSQVSVPATQS